MLKDFETLVTRNLYLKRLVVLVVQTGRLDCHVESEAPLLLFLELTIRRTFRVNARGLGLLHVAHWGRHLVLVTKVLWEGPLGVHVWVESLVVVACSIILVRHLSYLLIIIKVCSPQP